VSGVSDGGSMETLAEELSAIVRGNKRLTERVVSRHSQYLTDALKAYWYDQPDRHEIAESFGEILRVHGRVLGILQYAREVALSEVRKKHPSADIEAAFDAGMACWPTLIKRAQS
jgi:hypothetical protein